MVQTQKKQSPSPDVKLKIDPAGRVLTEKTRSTLAQMGLQLVDKNAPQEERGVAHIVEHLAFRAPEKFKDFEIVGTTYLVMNDSSGLEAAIARVECVLTLPIIDEFNPTLEDVNHLEVEVVYMRPGGPKRFMAVFLDTKNMSIEHAIGRGLDA